MSGITSGSFPRPAGSVAGQTQPVEQVHGATGAYHSDAEVDRAKKEADQPKVSVKPIASYQDSATGEWKHPDSGAYEVTRQRASELRANGLIDYASESDEHAAIEAQVKAAGDKRRAEIEARHKPKGPKLSAADEAKAKAPPAGSNPPLRTA